MGVAIASTPPAADRRTAHAVGARPWLRWVLLAVVWLSSALYVAPRMRAGWVPLDEGTLAQGAERVLRGELPHRDFDEVYTGGLEYVHAAAFRVLGTTLASLRATLFVAFLLWVPAVYFLALRFAPPVTAAGATLLALAWSVPAYPASLPSWYNLFLATFGAAALARFIDTGRRRWIFAAGVAGGVSVLIKIIGLYFVAAAVLALVFHEQETVPAAPAAPAAAGAVGGRERGGRAYSAFVLASLAALVAVLVALVRRRVSPEDLFYFVLPGAAVALLLARGELAARARSGATAARAEARFARLGALLLPLLGGLALPVALYVVPYARAGAVDALVRGVFVLPQQRLSSAGLHPVPLFTAMAAIPFALALGYVPAARRWFAGTAAPVGPLLLAALLGALLLAPTDGVYRSVWFSMFPLTPLAVLAGAWLLAREGERLSSRRRQELLALLAVTALCGLVQFPYADATYFCYVAPLGVLAALGVVTSERPVPRLGAPLVLAFHLLFAVVRMHPQAVWRLTGPYDPAEPLAALDKPDVPRGGGLVLRRSVRDDYARLVAVMRAHAAGAYAYATPDCPEVYFLTGLRNPTRTLFEFFDDPRDPTGRVLRLLDERGVSVVAINQRPRYSGPVPPALDSALAARYPRSERIGRFVVRWR